MQIQVENQPQFTAIRYELPRRWLLFDFSEVMSALIGAKAAVQALQSLPFQRTWVERLQELQLKREVAGTSRIEGAEFDDRELEAALRPGATVEELVTRSQKQAHAAVQTYRWLTTIAPDKPFVPDLLREVHRKLVTGCDDDHCAPGMLRGRDHNVTFGIPRHRGVEGGPSCEAAFEGLLQAFQSEWRDLDPLLKALALHYHLAAMHPFQDGNGRTARAAEALVLQRAGLTDRAFIAMSNYYYEEKTAYLQVLTDTRAAGHDLTAFFRFGLRGIRLQCEALTAEIRKQMQKALFRDTMYHLFNRLETERKRVIGKRQIEILKVLLESEELTRASLHRQVASHYVGMKHEEIAFFRDLDQLENLQAITDHWDDSGRGRSFVTINLDWPQLIDENEFLLRMKQMPKGKSFKFLG